MTDLRHTLAASSLDHQISHEESVALAKAAGGSESKLSHAIEAQGLRSWDADRLAADILKQASNAADSAPTAVDFPTPPPLRSDQRVAFTKGQQTRFDLVRSAPQQEPSDPAYLPIMSAGAVAAAVLVLDSASAKAAKQNAHAIVTLARELGENPDLNKAELAHFAEGKLSPKDVLRLQNLLLAMASHMPAERYTPGVKEGQLNALMGKLREHGALEHTTVITFRAETAHPARHPDRSLVGDQWTVDVDGVHVKPWANDGQDRSAVVIPAAGSPHPARTAPVTKSP